MIVKTDSKSNMEKFLELNRMITEAENHKCWKTALTSAGEAMRKYWNAAFKVSDMLKEYCEKYEGVDPLIEYDLRIVFRKGVHAEGPMRSVHETIEEALCNAGVSFSDFPENIEFDFDHVNFTRKDNQFFICGFDPDNDVYHNMSYELYLTPDEVLKAEDLDYVGKQISAYIDSIKEALKPCIDKVKRTASEIEKEEFETDRALYEKLKKRFEPEEAEESFPER